MKGDWGRNSEPGETRRQCEQKAELVAGGKEGAGGGEVHPQGQNRGLKE